MSELFNEIPRLESPRLEWMRKHAVICSCEDGVWTAYSPAGAGEGCTRDGALAAVAIKMGVPLWHEEKFLQQTGGGDDVTE